MNLAVWQIWMIAGLLLIFCEVFIMEFLPASFGIGCLAAGVANYFGLAYNVQLLVFCLFALASFFSLRPLFKRFVFKYRKKKKRAPPHMVGKTTNVTQTIENEKGMGSIHFGGESWRAVSENNHVISAGTPVVIKKIDRSSLIVSPADSPES
jgi:membrane protein implicated in regulation of membrane protease activity